MKHPDVVIIFIPSDGTDANVIGASRKGREWEYSKVVFIPASEVQDFIREELTPRGMLMFDCRESARLKQPGMEVAVPIIVYRPAIGLKAAVQAEAILHNAILESPE